MQNINRKSEDVELTCSAALLILWKTVSLLAVADFLHVHSFTIMALRFDLSSSYFLKCYSFRFLVRCPLLSNLRDLSVDLCFCPPGPSFELFLFFPPLAALNVATPAPPRCCTTSWKQWLLEWWNQASYIFKQAAGTGTDY